MGPVVGDSFTGWYEAPLGLGRTEFQLTVETAEGPGRWTGRGRDLSTISLTGGRRPEEREFTVSGRWEGQAIEWTKDFRDGSHTGIRYSGRLEVDEEGAVTVEGDYTFNFTKLWMSMQIKENFRMTLDK
jgi:hypothetical protein